MKTISRSKRMTTFRTVLIGSALMIGILTTLHAETANITQQHAPVADGQYRSTSRPDWNVDYPSQLGPQGVTASDASAVDPHRACDAPAPQRKR